MAEPFTLDGARQKVDKFEEDLGKLVPNPRYQRLIQIEREYTPTELSDLLQQFGSYLATLHATEGKIESECHLLKEGYKTGMSVAVAKTETSATTLAGKEAEVLVGNEGFREIRKMQIENEAILVTIKGWRLAYEAAYASISRIISLAIGEVTLQTGRHA